MTQKRVQIGRAQTLPAVLRLGAICPLPSLLRVGVSVLALWLTASGCARRAPASSEILRISQRNEPNDLDPATASLPDDFFIIRALGEGLLVPNPNGGAPLPGAAESHEVSADGLTYTFHLKPDGHWSNGDPVTAADFVAAYQRVLSPATAAPKANLFYAVRRARDYVTGKVTDFDQVGFHATGPRTLVVTLERPTANFLLEVASGPWIPTPPRVVAEHGRQWTEPQHHVGNGPFTLIEWRAQQRIVVRRNPRYRPANRGGVSEIHFVRLDNADAEERAYRAGQIDVTMAVPQSRLEVYERERPHELQRTPLAETRFLSFNTRRPVLADPRVRQALALALHREDLVRYVLKGGQLAADRFLSPALLERVAGSDAESPRVRHDPAEARDLLAAAGYPGGRSFPKLELAGWGQNPVLEAMQQMWRRELGIEVDIAVQEARAHLAAVRSGHYDIAFVTNLLDVRDPVSALHDFTTGAPNNFPQWSSPRFDRLLADAGQLADPHAASAAIAAAEAVLLDEAAVTPVYFNVQNWLMSPRVHGWEQDALWTRRYQNVSLK